jgi:hypothetical protein
MSGFDFNFGAGNNVTPYNFSVPTGMGVNSGQSGYGSLNTFGMPSPTSGANPDTISGLGSVPGANGGLGLNIPTLQLGLQGLSSIANLYTGLKALGLAQDQFSFQKQLSQTNLNNSVQSYNTALSDRANARGVAEGQTPGQVQSYINSNKLST